MATTAEEPLAVRSAPLFGPLVAADSEAHTARLGLAFWQMDTFADLQAAQGINGRVDPTDLAIVDLTDDERAAFLATLNA
jgi:hypothetical protein